MFQVLTLDGEEIGAVSKQWSGFIKELFADADNFGVKCMLLFHCCTTQFHVTCSKNFL